MSEPGQTTIIRKKRRRRRRRAPLFPFVLLGLALVGLMLGGMWLAKRRPAATAATLPEGYIADGAALRTEYERYYGSDNDLAASSGRFASARELAGKRNMPAVASVLEVLSKTAALPVVFHDLGLAYASLGDYTRAADAFREVLARDQEYAPTRKFLRDARGIPPGAAEPYTRELEPNNDNLAANLIALRTPVTGEIAGSNDTGDYFRMTAPPAPRDLIAIELTSHSVDFRPRLHVYDTQHKMQSWGEDAVRSGESLKILGGPVPNTQLVVSVASEDGKPGLYLLTVTPLKAFDRYEPNDEIMAARRISIGEEVSGNVMDAADTDFYMFESPRKGQVTIELRNRSNKLIPVLAVYNRDRRNMGFASDVQKPGSNLQHTIDAIKDQVYYLQVSSQGGSAGAYILRVD